MSQVYVFPGQGSQRRGMGRELFDAFPGLIEQADDVLGYSVRELCVEDAQGRLSRTEYTQPAMFVVNALTCLRHTEAGGRPPDFVLGHSLGEYNALHAAGVFDFPTGLRLVKKRSQLMAHVSGGAMSAVLGLGHEQAQGILSDFGLDTIEIANYNEPLQNVISGPAADIEAAEAIFKEAGVYAVRLNVSGAFHSRAMDAVQPAFAAFLGNHTFPPPRVSVIANSTARPYNDRDIATTLAQQMNQPVRWTESIEYLLERGATDFVELGPGEVLTGMIAKIRKHSAARSASPPPRR